MTNEEDVDDHQDNDDREHGHVQGQDLGVVRREEEPADTVAFIASFASTECHCDDQFAADRYPVKPVNIAVPSVSTPTIHVFHRPSRKAPRKNFTAMWTITKAKKSWTPQKWSAH